MFLGVGTRRLIERRASGVPNEKCTSTNRPVESANAGVTVTNSARAKAASASPRSRARGHPLIKEGGYGSFAHARHSLPWPCCVGRGTRAAHHLQSCPAPDASAQRRAYTLGRPRPPRPAAAARRLSPSSLISSRQEAVGVGGAGKCVGTSEIRSSKTVLIRGCLACLTRWSVASYTPCELACSASPQSTMQSRPGTHASPLASTSTHKPEERSRIWSPEIPSTA